MLKDGLIQNTHICLDFQIKWYKQFLKINHKFYYLQKQKMSFLLIKNKKNLNLKFQKLNKATITKWLED